MRLFLRDLKRKVLYNGYAEPVHKFLTHIASSDTDPFHPPKGKYLINLSFDFELSLSTYFWDHDFMRAKEYGTRAKVHYAPILKYVRAQRIPCNVQVVGMLLDSEFTSPSYMDTAHKDFFLQNREICTLSNTDIEMITDDVIELGIHGHSHRLFTNMSSAEAIHEVRTAIKVLKERCTSVGHEGVFMSFPRNKVAHEEMLSPCGVYAWRTNTQTVTSPRIVPRGQWFAPGVLSVSDMRRVLVEIRNKTPSYFLHLWSHFTEMDVRLFIEYIDVFRECGWEFTTVRSYLHHE